MKSCVVKLPVEPELPFSPFSFYLSVSSAQKTAQYGKVLAGQI